MNLQNARPLKIVFSWIVIILLTYLVTNSKVNVNNLPSITVSATSEVQATPNEARIRASLVTEGSNQNDTNKENTAQATTIVNALEKLGIEKKNIETSVSVNPKMKWQNDDYIEDGFIVTTSFNIKLTDTAKAEDVISVLTQNSAKNVSGPNFDLSKEEVIAYQTEAQTKALTDAKTQAEAMAKATGQKVGRILELTPGAASADGYYPYPVASRSAEASLSADAVAPESSRINPGEQTINASITVTFELK